MNREDRGLLGAAEVVIGYFVAFLGTIAFMFAGMIGAVFMLLAAIITTVFVLPIAAVVSWLYRRSDRSDLSRRARAAESRQPPDDRPVSIETFRQRHELGTQETSEAAAGTTRMHAPECQQARGSATHRLGAPLSAVIGVIDECTVTADAIAAVAAAGFLPTAIHVFAQRPARHLNAEFAQRWDEVIEAFRLDHERRFLSVYQDAERDGRHVVLVSTAAPEQSRELADLLAQFGAHDLKILTPFQAVDVKRAAA